MEKQRPQKNPPSQRTKTPNPLISKPANDEMIDFHQQTRKKGFRSSAESRRKAFRLVCLFAGLFFTLVDVGGVLYMRFTHRLIRSSEAAVDTVYIRGQSGLDTSDLTLLNDHYILMDDFTVTQPFANPSQTFTGVFEGNGHVLTVYGTDLVPFFSTIARNGVVRNLGIVVKGKGNLLPDVFGVLAGQNLGTIENCYIVEKDILKVKGGQAVGGLVGVNSGTISHSYAIAGFDEDAQLVTEYSEGGLTGMSLAGAKMDHCFSWFLSAYLEANVSPMAAGTLAIPHFGGISGYWNTSNSADFTHLYSYNPTSVFLSDRNSPLVDFVSRSRLANPNFTFWTDDLALDSGLWTFSINNPPALIPNSIYQSGGNV